VTVVTKINYKGFTLIETILACVILCTSILVLGAICTRSLSGIRLNRQYEQAAALVEKQLVFIDYIGIKDFMGSGQLEGDIEQSGQTYHWQASVKRVNIENLYDVKVTVVWTERNHNYDVSACTRFIAEGLFGEAAEL